jgi:hypothetical protein
MSSPPFVLVFPPFVLTLPLPFPFTPPSHTFPSFSASFPATPPSSLTTPPPPLLLPLLLPPLLLLTMERRPVAAVENRLTRRFTVVFREMNFSLNCVD